MSSMKHPAKDNGRSCGTITVMQAVTQGDVRAECVFA